MESIRQFRNRTSAATMLVSAVIGLLIIVVGDSRPAGFGFVIGGVSGALGFWHIASQGMKVASMDRDKLNSFLYARMVVRMGIYLVCFYLAFRLDPTRYWGVLGAVGGLLMVQVVLVVYGLLRSKAFPPTQ